jgi:hypothetical protein
VTSFPPMGVKAVTIAVGAVKNTINFNFISSLRSSARCCYSRRLFNLNGNHGSDLHC